MNVLTIHKFHYIEGGAERYVFNLSELLQKKGNVVIPFSMHHPKNFHSPYSDYFVSHFNPDQLRNSGSFKETLKIAGRVMYNKEAQQRLAQLIKETKPDIAHVHSIYHHISPSIFKTLREHKIPVIMTLHDFKLVCPNIVFLDGKNRVCEACKGKYFWMATLKKCFRNSYGASLLATMEASLHYMLNSYRGHVDVFHSPSAFLANKIQGYGYDHKPVKVLPYTLDVQSFDPHYGESDYFVYAGRMSVEKGVLFLVDAMRRIKDFKLYLIGTGPLDAEIKRRIETYGLTEQVRQLGYQSGDELRSTISKAAFTVMPSLCHDNSPLAIYESLSLGNAILGSDNGGIPELINDGVDGYTFRAGDEDDFVNKVEKFKDPQACVNMGKQGREKAEQLFSPDEHYRQLMKLYEQTIEFHFTASR